MSFPAHSGPWPLIQFRNNFSQTVGLLGRVISPSQGSYLHTGQHKHRINAYTHQASMIWVGFEPTIPASERAKTVHALDRAATVTGYLHIYITIILYVVGRRRLVAGVPLLPPEFDPRSWGICGGQSGTWAGFLRRFLFSHPVLIPPSAPR
jgi:hypothetical protein